MLKSCKTFYMGGMLKCQRVVFINNSAIFWQNF